MKREYRKEDGNHRLQGSRQHIYHLKYLVDSQVPLKPWFREQNKNNSFKMYDK